MPSWPTLPGAALGAATQDGYVSYCKSLGREAVLSWAQRWGEGGDLGDGGLMVPVEPQPHALSNTYLQTTSLRITSPDMESDGREVMM